ncbi:metalloregulator ArsR/SmtB family transcription factor [uncultured Hoeflea sp.]|uniref:ArsR/SmtB family transcription factor n=1 Tax=uncultured Hoeflea sp. TaxID=538666 RepID=UPI00260A7973|nr:metalloregulator ArsR/SmtB family transcription factor [uncultured Hoeflea sp.]
MKEKSSQSGGRSHSDNGDEAVARKLAALAHPVRLRLLRHMATTKTCCVKDMVAEVGMAQSTVSQHLKMLVDAGLVGYRSERQRSCYHVNADALDELVNVVGQTLDYCCGKVCGSDSGGSCEIEGRQAGATTPPSGSKDM